MNKLLFLEKKSKLFFLGIGGISMSSLALAAKKNGHEVTGYDAAASNITRTLEENGIAVYHSFDKKHYDGVSLIVYTGAIHDDDIVLSYPRSLGIPEMKRPTFLGLMMKESRNPIGVSGTHGKSTTTGMLSSIFLSEEGRDPTILAGAVVPAVGSAFRLGEGEDFLFEACEYQNSFLDFYPRISLILNVEHDHADFFPDLRAVQDSFVKFADRSEECAIINYDSPGARVVAEETKTKTYYFSVTEKKDFWCENLTEEKGFFSFDIMTKNGCFTSVSLSVAGIHNVSNALAAAGAAYLSGISAESVKKGLEAFRGVKRRFEYRGKCGKMQVFDDYAHHPDEICATLGSAKKMGYEKITVVFQSHTFSRTEALWDDFVSALSLADSVIVADIYPAREKPIPKITGKALAEDLENGMYLGDFDAIASYLKDSTDGGILLVMGAGDIVNLTDLLLTDKAK
ncbi:MAG: UDP-N-acetylmuramate--L-alanine ligase [Clostridia bacterium]|nr:UDP-N-acetylmuramate--L-alanine ligase [Clostridia bacterium]